MADPAQLDTIAKLVRMPSRPPNTTVRMRPPTAECSSAWPPGVRFACAAALCSTSSAEYAVCALLRSTCVFSDGTAIPPGL